MRRLMLWSFCFYFATVMAAQAARSGNGPWSVTLYAGPSTNKFMSQIFVDGQYKADGGMIGLAADRKLFNLGWDISAAAEGQVTQYAFGHRYTTIALGVGVQFNNLFNFRRTPMSLSVYTGPSYATFPPEFGIGYDNQHLTLTRQKWLNYLAVEFAVGIPAAPRWDAVFRLYHRSGAFGFYSIAADEGTAMGIGIRRRF